MQHIDVFNCAELLMNNVDIKLILTPNTSEFCVLKNGDDAKKYRVEIVEASLVIYRNQMNDGMLLETMNSLSRMPAQLHGLNGRVLTYTKPQGVRTIELPNAIIGSKLPNRIIIGMVDNAAYTGNDKIDPFNFQHFNLESFDIKINSRSVYPNALKFDIENDIYTDGYYHLLHAMGYTGSTDGCSVDKSTYKANTFLLAANITPTQTNGSYEDPLRQGNVVIKLQFAVPLPVTISIIVYYEYTATVRINKLRKAMVDYNF